MSPEEVDPTFEALLDHIREERGFDLTGYKRASLTRRFNKRMHHVDAGSYEEYRALLDDRPEEYAALFDTVLINVTGFLRDGPAWEHLADEVLPRILASRPEDEPFRVWSAGCASGEEAYSLAVLLCDALGDDRFRSRVKIYGSDADEDAIRQARLARYPGESLEGAFTPTQVERYFEASGAERVFRKDLRRCVVFGRHDLVQDPPISRIDLLVCRNTLMYLNADVQRRVLEGFHFALNDGGFLFLGRSEALVTRSDLFTVQDITHHVFAKDPESSAGRPPLPPLRRRDPPTDDSLDGALVESAFESGPLAQFVVDSHGRLVRANRRARTLFSLTVSQLGQPLKDAELSYRPVELRSLIEQVVDDHRQVIINDVEWQGPDGVSDVYEVRLAPVGPDIARPGVIVSFTETGEYQLLRRELDRSQRELQAAWEELQSTVEELETTNEELQSTNEELETTNEELHSSNEELETMNEELQSTNEELETINEELRRSTAELDRVNAYLGSILASLGSAVVVLDRNLRVQVWNDDATELWGLRADEVDGEDFLELDIGLPVAGLGPMVRSVLGAAVADGSSGDGAASGDGQGPPDLGASLGVAWLDGGSADGASADGASADGAPADGWSPDGASADGGAPDGSMVVDAVNRRGQPVRCEVLVTPLPANGDRAAGVIIRMDVVDVEERAGDRR